MLIYMSALTVCALKNVVVLEHNVKISVFPVCLDKVMELEWYISVCLFDDLVVHEMNWPVALLGLLFDYHGLV